MIQQFFERVTEIAGGNQFLVGALSVYGLGVLTFICRRIPAGIYTVLKKHLTTSMTLTSHNESFYEILAWLEREGFAARFRRIKLTNGKWGSSNEISKSVGMGRHLFWFRRVPMTIELVRLDSHAEHDKEELTLVKLGRSHRVFDALITELRARNGAEGFTKVHAYQDECWQVASTQPPRDIKSIFIDHENLDAVISAISSFKAKESWFIRHGIPYQLGILLYGPPGCGKTSLIRAIAAHCDKDIRLLPAAHVNKLGSALADVEKPDNSILVVEDIDSNSVTTSRTQPEEGILARPSGGGISEVLNALDGVTIGHGRIMVLTTNHIEKLDPALIRPGRIDLKVELGYVTPAIFADFVKAFFNVRYTITGVKPGVTVAELQTQVMLGKTLDEILNEVRP